ncbi:MAG: hypothetical protein GF418_16035 [Chitinivibrionales bacterium]|nr:hypothetical protein [Chitinivibrionales bacterium]
MSSEEPQIDTKPLEHASTHLPSREENLIQAIFTKLRRGEFISQGEYESVPEEQLDSLDITVDADYYRACRRWRYFSPAARARADRKETP